MEKYDRIPSSMQFRERAFQTAMIQLNPKNASSSSFQVYGQQKNALATRLMSREWHTVETQRIAKFLADHLSLGCRSQPISLPMRRLEA